MIDDLYIGLISYANIWLKTDTLFCIVLKFNNILTFKLILLMIWEKKHRPISNGALIFWVLCLFQKLNCFHRF